MSGGMTGETPESRIALLASYKPPPSLAEIVEPVDEDGQSDGR